MTKSWRAVSTLPIFFQLTITHRTSPWRTPGKEQSQLPEFAIDNTGLMIAASEELSASHRHRSHMSAIYPLGLFNPNKAKDKVVIDKSLRWLEKLGTRSWNGYSFSWVANLYARAKEGNHAARALHIFSINFCSPNRFHLNGYQHGGQFSASTSSPFALEGHFAFAGAVHEMLLQSYTGAIEVFPQCLTAGKMCRFMI